MYLPKCQSTVKLLTMWPQYSKGGMLKNEKKTAVLNQAADYSVKYFVKYIVMFYSLFQFCIVPAKFSNPFSLPCH